MLLWGLPARFTCSLHSLGIAHLSQKSSSWFCHLPGFSCCELAVLCPLFSLSLYVFLGDWNWEVIWAIYVVNSWLVHCLSALSVDMTALCCPNSYMHCHVVQGAVRVVQVHMELWLLTDSGYDLSVSSFYMLDMLHFKVINTDAIKLTCLSPYPFSGHFEARLMKQELHLLPKMSLVCHGFVFFFFVCLFSQTSL